MIDKPEGREGPNTELLTGLLARLARRPLKTSDATQLREAFGAEGFTTWQELDIAFAIEARAADRCREWSDLFVSLATDFLVWGERPTGVLTEENATWVLNKVDATQTGASLFLLINVLDEATKAPDWYAEAVRSRALAVFGATAQAPSPRQAA